MLYDSLCSEYYNLDYADINELNLDLLHQGTIESDSRDLKSKYDFYIFNYHHYTMRNVENVLSRRFPNLNARTFCVVLEMVKDDPFIFMNPPGFTDFIVMDPTMNRQEPNIHAFPRPLTNFKEIKRVETIPKCPLIGSFGYPTIDKGFHLIVKAAAKEFDSAHIRINLSKGTYTEERYRQEIENECKKYLRSGITIDFTDHYFNDEELIEWCSENTINCFFYTRSIPGLAAATDQVIMSGAPLAIGENTTFRHIHQYITPYPQISLRESILTSQAGIQRIRENWCKEKIVEKMRTILES